VGQGEVADAVADRPGADDLGQRPDPAQARPRGEEADEQDDLGPDRGHQSVEPGPAERLLGRRGEPISPLAREPTRVAAGDGREVDLAVEVLARDAPGLEPVAQAIARCPRERPSLVRRPQSRGLADQENPRDRRIGLGVAGDRDRLALVEESREVTPTAGADLDIERGESGASRGHGHSRMSIASP
jgi:hypothetical protein